MSDLTDAATDAARAAHERGERVDHDLHRRNARTRMSAFREGQEWLGTDSYGLLDLMADQVLIALPDNDDQRTRTAIEALAFALGRPYDEVVARGLWLRSRAST